MAYSVECGGIAPARSFFGPLDKKVTPIWRFFLWATPYKGCPRQKTGRPMRFVKRPEKTVRRFFAERSRKVPLKWVFACWAPNEFSVFLQFVKFPQKDPPVRASLLSTVTFSARRNPARAPIATVGTSLRSRFARQKGGLLEK